ncbi:hypothetical protein MMC20_004853 [Loxospora ochrophaea]|nr:hypothetical protein [Loxospora ochrophaea]
MKTNSFSSYRIMRFLCQSRNYSGGVPLDSIPASKRKHIPTSGTYPKGFLASSVYVGVKPSRTTPDLALVASSTPCSAAAVFTKNKFQAAPVTVSRQTLSDQSGNNVRGIVINSGCANAVTGQGGIEDAISMSQAVSACFSSSQPPSSTPANTLVMSTGVIGSRLPISKILSGIPSLHQSLSPAHSSWLAAASAICTTDTFPKLLSTTFTLPSAPQITYSLAGMTKGAGMIHPNMATLLGILCTDAPIAPTALQPLLTYACDRSYNAISIDGDTSTNDTVAILANGAAGGSPQLSSADPTTPDFQAMQKILTRFTQQLSQLVVRDAEGATKFVHIHVMNAKTSADAQSVAASIARSPLVKTALYGKDANWGRIACAVGYTDGLSEGAVIPEKTSLSFIPVDGSAELKLLVSGVPEAVNEERAAQILEAEDLQIQVDLETGTEEGNYWTCDLSHEYVTINGDYRT